jgi:hypothetical protein
MRDSEAASRWRRIHRERPQRYEPLILYLGPESLIGFVAATGTASQERPTEELNRCEPSEELDFVGPAMEHGLQL